MINQEVTNTIWQNIKGAERYLEIYGFYPTFHDAHILSFEVKSESKTICLKIYYSDGSNKEVKTVSEICWRNFVKAEYNFSENEILHFGFEKIGNLILTKFEAVYLAGNILSESLEITDIEIISKIFDEEKPDFYKMQLNIF